MKSIMVATDFSERSDRALRRATLLAKQHGATLSIIHVVDDDQPLTLVEHEQDVSRKLLRDLRATIREEDGVACEARIETGAPFAAIVEAAKKDAPDLLVLGPHRRAVLRDVFVGTTAERTIRSVDCPVLMVNAPPVGPYRKILMTTDLSEAAQQALRTFTALGIHTKTNVTLAHVYIAPAVNLAMSGTMAIDAREAYLKEESRSVTSALAAFAASADAEYAVPLARHSVRRPDDEIIALAKEHAADLIVVGTHARIGLAKFFLGSVAEEVLRNADRDVLSIPPLRTS